MEIHEIKKIVQTAAGGKPAAFTIHLRQPLDYQSNRLYDVWLSNQHWIAKEFLKNDELFDAPRREIKALEHLLPLDLAPRPIFCDPSLGPVVVYEYMEGVMWDRQPPSETDLSQLAAAWLKINSVQVDWFSRGSERGLPEIENQFRAGLQAFVMWATNNYPPARKTADLCLNLFEKRRQVVQELAELEPVYCFCRSDPRFANVIRRQAAPLGFVDWEDSGLRDPARELADLIMHPNQEDLLTWEEWQPFRQPFLERHCQADQYVVNRSHLYLAIFPFFWLTGLMNLGIKRFTAGMTDAWLVNGLPANQRLRRYLARALAWPDTEFSSQLKTLSEERFFPGDP
jgi:aminoglycoside phosphotransferase (APT) family kinase protein